MVQLETRLIETELKALKHQLNPHLLFNTMNNISVLVRDNRKGDAVQLIAQLSSLLRTSFRKRPRSYLEASGGIGFPYSLS